MSPTSLDQSDVVVDMLLFSIHLIIAAKQYESLIHQKNQQVQPKSFQDANKDFLVFCWGGQFIGHGIFEKRAPALADNFAQALQMGPYFVLLELLQSAFGYEPYPGFYKSVKAKIEANIKEWKVKNQKKLS